MRRGLHHVAHPWGGHREKRPWSEPSVYPSVLHSLPCTPVRSFATHSKQGTSPAPLTTTAHTCTPSLATWGTWGWLHVSRGPHAPMLPCSHAPMLPCPCTTKGSMLLHSAAYAGCSSCTAMPSWILSTREAAHVDPLSACWGAGGSLQGIFLRQVYVQDGAGGDSLGLRSAGPQGSALFSKLHPQYTGA
jgi:hypothetical protein